MSTGAIGGTTGGLTGGSTQQNLTQRSGDALQTLEEGKQGVLDVGKCSPCPVVTGSRLS